MGENYEKQEAVQKKDLSDAEVLNKVFANIKLQRSRLDKQLDLLHISIAWRVFLLVLLILNLYLFSFFSIPLLIIVFPIIILPLLMYGHYIWPSVMLLNISTSALFIMRYRHHRIIFYISLGVFLVSTWVFIQTISSLISYFAMIQTFK